VRVHEPFGELLQAPHAPTEGTREEVGNCQCEHGGQERVPRILERTAAMAVSSSSSGTARRSTWPGSPAVADQQGHVAKVAVQRGAMAMDFPTCFCFASCTSGRFAWFSIVSGSCWESASTTPRGSIR